MAERLKQKNMVKMRENVIQKISIKHRDLDYLGQLKKRNMPSANVETTINW